MLVRLRTLAFLTLALAGWSQMDGGTLLFAQSAERDQKNNNSATQEGADKDMEIGRYYIGKRDYTGAITRFKKVVMQYPTSSYVEEALARLTEAYLARGMHSDAQTAVAVLDRKFPNGRWSIDAKRALEAAGLQPAENDKSWMSVPLR